MWEAFVAKLIADLITFAILGIGIICYVKWRNR